MDASRLLTISLLIETGAEFLTQLLNWLLGQSHPGQTYYGPPEGLRSVASLS